MSKELRNIVYDKDLHLEALRFPGIVEGFPNHFHDYYTIGYIEKGERNVFCNGKGFSVKAGDITIFNPGDYHSCVQTEGDFVYCAMNISIEVMTDLTEIITGKREQPYSSKSVIYNHEMACCFYRLLEMILYGSNGFAKEEHLIMLVYLLICECSQPPKTKITECRDEIKRASSFMEQHFNEHISLDHLCSYVNLSKSTLLRAFTKEIGLTPYSYLESIRIGKAKELLGTGTSPINVAMLTGFSDQSHFTHDFRRYFGISPAAYREIFFANSKMEVQNYAKSLSDH